MPRRELIVLAVVAAWLCQCSTNPASLEPSGDAGASDTVDTTGPSAATTDVPPEVGDAHGSGEEEPLCPVDIHFPGPCGKAVDDDVDGSIDWSLVYYYDSEDMCVLEQHFSESGVQLRSVVYTMVHDDQGRLVELHAHTSGEYHLCRVTYYTYVEPDVELYTEDDSLCDGDVDLTVTIVVDSDAKIKSWEQDPGADGIPLEVYSCITSADGLTTECESAPGFPPGVTTYTYNDDGFLLTHEHTDEWVSSHSEYEYDNGNNLLKSTSSTTFDGLTNERAATYSYDCWECG